MTLSCKRRGAWLAAAAFILSCPGAGFVSAGARAGNTGVGGGGPGGIKPVLPGSISAPGQGGGVLRAPQAGLGLPDSVVLDISGSMGPGPAHSIQAGVLLYRKDGQLHRLRPGAMSVKPEAAPHADADAVAAAMAAKAQADTPQGAVSASGFGAPAAVATDKTLPDVKAVRDARAAKLRGLRERRMEALVQLDEVLSQRRQYRKAVAEADEDIERIGVVLRVPAFREARARFKKAVAANEAAAREAEDAMWDVENRIAFHRGKDVHIFGEGAFSGTRFPQNLDKAGYGRDDYDMALAEYHGDQAVMRGRAQAVVSARDAAWYWRKGQAGRHAEIELLIKDKKKALAGLPAGARTATMNMAHEHEGSAEAAGASVLKDKAAIQAEIDALMAERAAIEDAIPQITSFWRSKRVPSKVRYGLDNGYRYAVFQIDGRSYRFYDRNHAGRLEDGVRRVGLDGSAVPVGPVLESNGKIYAWTEEGLMVRGEDGKWDMHTSAGWKDRSYKSQALELLAIGAAMIGGMVTSVHLGQMYWFLASLVFGVGFFFHRYSRFVNPSLPKFSERVGDKPKASGLADNAVGADIT